MDSGGRELTAEVFVPQNGCRKCLAHDQKKGRELIGTGNSVEVGADKLICIDRDKSFGASTSKRESKSSLDHSSRCRLKGPEELAASVKIWKSANEQIILKIILVANQTFLTGSY